MRAAERGAKAERQVSLYHTRLDVLGRATARRKTPAREADDAEERKARIDEVLERARDQQARAGALIDEANRLESRSDTIQHRLRARKNQKV